MATVNELRKFFYLQASVDAEMEDIIHVFDLAIFDL